jgi:hypothetical protein
VIGYAVQPRETPPVCPQVVQIPMDTYHRRCTHGDRWRQLMVNGGPAITAHMCDLWTSQQVNTTTSGAQQDVARHFFIGSKDRSAPFLAREVHIEVFIGPNHRAAYDEARRRLDR